MQNVQRRSVCPNSHVDLLNMCVNKICFDARVLTTILLNFK